MLSLEAQGDPFESLVNFVKAIVAPGQNEKRAIEEAVRAGFAENFANESSGDGSSWTALAGRTNVDRQRRGFPTVHPILARTGRYRAGFTVIGAPNSLSEEESNGSDWTLYVGSSDERRILEKGGTTIIQGKQVYVPPRPATILSDQAESNIASVIERVIAQIEDRTLEA
jgi:hypothetical protein